MNQSIDTNNVYVVGKSDRGCPAIRINRKPSQIPRHIDMELSHSGGVITHMDGPNNRVTYEFLIPEKLPAAEAYLKSCGWIGG